LHSEEPNLFTYSTSRLAGEKAALNERSRKARILQLLKDHGPLALFEIAQMMQVHDHQISGRITELYRDDKIDTTGQRRTNPATGCAAEVYQLHKPRPL
jgi:predicted ArsR family transcriptional regulator